MAISIIPTKPKRYYLPLSLSFDDTDCRYKRWQYNISQSLRRTNINNLQYFDAELFVHTIIHQPDAMPMQQSFIKNQLKQVECISKQMSSQQLSKHSPQLALTQCNGEQIFQKCYNERSKNINSKKFSKIFPTTKHNNNNNNNNLLSIRNEIDANNAINLIDQNYNMNLGIKLLANASHSNRLNTEQRLKTTFITSAEKMKHIFYRNTKMIENPATSKGHKYIQKLQHPMKYFTDEDSDVFKLIS
ncbi:Uncharacterized protein BM_BM17781 [Brugia malayi]|uniref:Uncharacterized protein n=1 Tax=Brugia malayi TaxID=6279 RepID=A0A4E9FWQ1_BRUMA|nr:Uncharacterized protein BM_BM17781 [Brugia malayi]VIO99063.1 Uncharacterized protein BM_BM17781 [Brugia malayi]